jgi:hypothetical protein
MEKDLLKTPLASFRLFTASKGHSNRKGLISSNKVVSKFDVLSKNAILVVIALSWN